MIKITDIEALLNLPFKATIDLWEIPERTLTDLQNLYSGSIYEGANNKYYHLHNDNVKLILNTSKKH